MNDSLNGVNVQQLVGTIDAIKNESSIANFTFHAKTTWIDGGHCKTEIKNFSGANTEDKSREKPFLLEGDEPPVLLGKNQGANAVEALLHALGSCLSVGVVYNAAARNIKIDDLRFEMTGDINLHAFLGLSESVRPGYSSIQVTVHMNADGSEEQLEELCRYVEKTSPVMDCLRDPVPVKMTLVSAKETQNLLS